MEINQINPVELEEIEFQAEAISELEKVPYKDVLKDLLSVYSSEPENEKNSGTVSAIASGLSGAYSQFAKQFAGFVGSQKASIGPEVPTEQDINEGRKIVGNMKTVAIVSLVIAGGVGAAAYLNGNADNAGTGDILKKDGTSNLNDDAGNELAVKDVTQPEKIEAKKYGIFPVEYENVWTENPDYVGKELSEFIMPDELKGKQINVNPRKLKYEPNVPGVTFYEELWSEDRKIERIIYKTEDMGFVFNDKNGDGIIDRAFKGARDGSMSVVDDDGDGVFEEKIR